MKKSMGIRVLMVICIATLVSTGEPDPSFTNSLASFLSSLFGSDNSTTTTISAATSTASLESGTPTTSVSPKLQASVQSGQPSNETTETDLSTNLTTQQSTNLTTTENNPPNVTGTVKGMDQSTTAQSTTESPISTTDSFPTTFSSFMTSSYYSSTLQSLQEGNVDQCYQDTVIQNYCSSPGDLTDVSFWDLYSAIFSDSVIDGLMMACVRGTWCLKDKYDYWDALIAERVDIVTNSEIAYSMCRPQVLGCLGEMADFFKNCSFYYQMKYTTKSIDLLCKMKTNSQLTDGCYKHVIEALHVTLADLVREKSQPKDYIEQNSDDTCDTPEAYMTQGLICITNSCPGETETFKSFGPWTWFTNIVDELISECQYNITECVALLQKPPGYIEPEDLQMMIIISATTMISAILMSLSVCLCYRRYRRNAVIKDGYQQLLNDGDES